VDYSASRRQALRKISARRAKYLSTKGLNEVVHRLAAKTCTDAVENYLIGHDDAHLSLVRYRATHLRNS